MREWLEPLGLESTVVDDLTLAAHEAALNSVEHAFVDRPAGTVEVVFWIERANLFLQVTDDGHWRADDGHTDRGRGITLMRHLTGAVLIRHQPAGTQVLLCHPLPATTAPAERETA